MKAKRYKNAYKTLTFFKHNYQIVPPYRVIVDGPFCMAALQNKINLREQLPKYLDAVTEIVTTKCVLHELQSIGLAVHGAAVVCKQFDVDNCPHNRPIAARDCIAHLAKKARNGGTKYIIATQDDILKEQLRAIFGTPILFIGFNAILFDKLTEEAKNAVNPDNLELQKVKELRKEILGESVVKKKKKKIKGKNPLSCKKKIVKQSEQPQRTGDRTATGKRRRRKKISAASVSTETASA